MTEEAVTEEAVTEEVVLSAADMAAAHADPEPVTNGVQPKDDDDDVLDLTSLVPPRKLVRVPTLDNPKGEAYELRLLDDFGIVEQQQLLRWSRKFEELWNQSDKDLDENERVQLKHLLDSMFEKVLDAPDEIKAQIPDVIRSRVVTAFTLVPLLERQKQEAKEQEAKEALTESQSTSES